MEVPRRLYTTETGEICEEGDPKARFLLSAKGGVISEAEAERLGLLRYLAEHAAVEEPAVKMVEQSTVEDKAVEGPTAVKEVAEEPATEPATEPPAETPQVPPSEEPSIQIGGQSPQETRRTGGGRRT